MLHGKSSPIVCLLTLQNCQQKKLQIALAIWSAHVPQQNLLSFFFVCFLEGAVDKGTEV